MKRFLAAALLFAVCVSPAFAASKRPHKQPHQKYDYHYKTPKYKAPKAKGHHTPPKHTEPHQAK